MIGRNQPTHRRPVARSPRVRTGGPFPEPVSSESDDGSILPLAVFFGALALIVVLLAVSATSLYLERERLFALADAAALAGAEAYELNDVRVVDGSPRPALDSGAVHREVAAYLRSSGSGAFDDLAIERANSIDGRSATVRLAAVWHPPVVSLLVPHGVAISVTSTARSVFW